MENIKISSVLTGIFISLLLSSCAESNEKFLARMESMLAGGEKQKALLEIENTLNDLNEDQTETIRNSESARSFIRNSSGNTVAWLEEDRVYFYNGELDSISLDEKSNILRISDNGKYALAYTLIDDQCLLFPMSFETNDVFPEIILEKCEGGAAISDSGEIWYPQNGSILRKKNPGGADEAEIVLDKKKFTEKYKKIKNEFNIFSGPNNTLVIFFGNAGYYYLYNYDIETGKLIKSDMNPVKPDIHWAEKDDVLFPENSKNAATDTGAYLYTGSIGKFNLSFITFSGRMKSGNSFDPPPASSNFIPVSDGGSFYFINEKSQICIFDSKKNSIKVLPIKGNSLTVIKAGLLYNDESNNLKLRRTPFSDFENKLLILQNKAQKN